MRQRPRLNVTLLGDDCAATHTLRAGASGGVADNMDGLTIEDEEG